MAESDLVLDTVGDATRLVSSNSATQLLLSPSGKSHPLVTNRTLRLLACKISGHSHELSSEVKKLLESLQKSSWCSKRSYDTFELPTNLILEYLKDVFHDKGSHTAVYHCKICFILLPGKECELER